MNVGNNVHYALCTLIEESTGHGISGWHTQNMQATSNVDATCNMLQLTITTHDS
jgi:hypothetical protein